MGVVQSALAYDYLEARQLTTRLQHLAEQQNHLVRIQRLGLTARSHELWVVEVGAGSPEERQNRPAMLAVAGLEGTDLVGTTSLIAWIEGLVADYATNSGARHLLETTTLYIFPRLNPDAAESFFARPRQEILVNTTATDDDHDGLVDEDGPEDLDGDGQVTSMRVADPEGEFILDPADNRVLIKADKAKGEKGAWKLFPEGIDNDRDERWNEDGPGGVNLNRNFPYNYQFFGPDAGRHQVSEPESRALADFVVNHLNIALVFAFGAQDNLTQTPKAEPGGKRPPTAISETDLPYYQELGRAYRDLVGLKKELTTSTPHGTFADWIYFDRGRLGLATRSWFPELEMERARPEKAPEEAKPDADKNPASPAPGKETKPPAEKRGEDERALLKWIDQNILDAFVPWKEFRHPDFPNQRVEIGGWAPFARSNPPLKLLDAVVERHTRFLTDLARRLPRIGLRKLTARHLGRGVYEVTVQVENSGYLPTALSQGVLNMEVHRTRVVLQLTDDQILAGQRITQLGPLAGSGGMQEVRYVLRAQGPVKVRVVSMLGGTVEGSIDLREDS